jgi:predicted dehydrogenase
MTSNINKIWLVGAGYWGSKVALAIERQGITADIIDIENGQTIDEISALDLDPVVIATPLWDHYTTAKTLIEKGHDVYVEKPLAETLEQCIDLRNSMQSDDQILMVGHIFLYHPHCIQLKQIMVDGVLGEIKHIKTERLNWGIYQTKTTPLLSIAPHDISIIQYLTNDIINVIDVTVYNLSNNYATTYDRLHFTGHCHELLIEVDVSWYSPVRRRVVTVTGTKGCAIWDTDAETLTITNHSKLDNNTLNENIQTEVIPYTGNTPLENEIEHFIHCVDTRETPKTDVYNAIQVANTIDQIASLTISNR